MKKIILFSILYFTILSCSSQIFNYVLQKQGIYNDNISVKKMKYKEKEILFLPIHHAGTEKFYTNINNKIDSLIELNYFFFTEKVIMNNSDKLELMKFRKIVGFALPKEGYKKILDSILTEKKIVLKTKIVFQPDYSEWKLNDNNSTNTDATVHELINYYESKYGEIKLEECDLAVTDVSNNTKCRKNKHTGAYETLVLNYRNNLIANAIKNDSRQKIALIYGAGHYEGIKKILDSLDRR
ncbi:hypothetical protein [Chryseobacterium turcicum]|uniref:Uncharacterized protein n=1 Tax=Chryseobacterium turcicum TaxID=2898076 RepID=A0A9Q3YUI0_9FLAO|nr:hypothetical protein [Chryseobacterium turcicum]MCD1116396.1 hypothetical protein [Chryseobacterium turcicum]